MKIQVRYRKDSNEPFFFDVHSGKEVSVYQIQDVLNKLLETGDKELVEELTNNFHQGWKFKSEFRDKAEQMEPPKFPKLRRLFDRYIRRRYSRIMSNKHFWK